MENVNYCYKPFNEIEIYSDGKVFTCCPDFFKTDNYIGNIFECKSFDEIWYSEKAVKLRKNILNNDYSLCNTDICNKEYRDNIVYACYPPYPKNVRLSYDLTCNVKCIYCRDYVIPFKNEDFWNKAIDTVLKPVIKNCKMLTISTVGEVTASPHSQSIIKKAIKINKNIKFELLSNGLLLNEAFYKKLKLKNKIESILITIPGMTESTYNSIVRGSDFSTVIKNIEWLSKLRSKNEIPNFSLSFVVSAYNYKEIPDFISFGIRNNAFCNIWELRNKHNSSLYSKFDELAVWKPSNPKYEEFVGIIQYVKNNFSKSNYTMPPLFTNLKPVSQNIINN